MADISWPPPFHTSIQTNKPNRLKLSTVCWNALTKQGKPWAWQFPCIRHCLNGVHNKGRKELSEVGGKKETWQFIDLNESNSSVEHKIRGYDSGDVLDQWVRKQEGTKACHQRRENATEEQEMPEREIPGDLPTTDDWLQYITAPFYTSETRKNLASHVQSMAASALLV